MSQLTLTNHRMLIAKLAPDLDRIAATIADPIVQRRVNCARARLEEAIGEIDAAIALADTAARDELLLIEVISPGADRADELVADIPADVLSLSDRAATSRLDLPYNADGARMVDAIMYRNGWRQNGVGWWDRPGFGAAAGVARPAGQPL